MVILHITHTDISRDIRILKELEALGTSFQKTAKIIGIGLKSDSGPTHATSLNGVELKAIEIPFINKKYLKGTIKHILTFLVLLFSMLFFGLKYRPQIVHCHDTMVLPVGLILKIVLRCKLIYDAHELESERNGISKIASIYTRTLEKIGWQYIDLLIAVSPSIIAWYQENYGMKTIVSS